MDDVLRRARASAPAVGIAAARVEEARGRLAGASVLLQANPLLEAALGPRLKDDGLGLEAGVGISQSLELGGRRGARIAAAQAGVDLGVASGERSIQLLLRDATVAFARALHAQERVSVAEAAARLATELADVAERRRQAGEIAVLEANVARTVMARSQSELRSAEAARAGALAGLRLLMGMGAAEPLVPQGELRRGPARELPALLTASAERPDLRALTAQLREARADKDLGEALGWPDLGVGAQYERDDQDSVVLGTISLTLPVFSRGQELRATGLARATQAELALAAAQRAAEIEVRSGFERHGKLLEAVRELERSLPLLEENESLARKSYEAGEIDLAQLLLVRRETLEARNAYLDRLLDAAVSAAELDFSARVTP